MSDLEKERKELNQINRELLLLDGDFDKLERKLRRLKERRNVLYFDIDKKLDGG